MPHHPILKQGAVLRAELFVIGQKVDQVDRVGQIGRVGRAPFGSQGPRRQHGSVGVHGGHRDLRFAVWGNGGESSARFGPAPAAREQTRTRESRRPVIERHPESNRSSLTVATSSLHNPAIGLLRV